MAHLSGKLTKKLVENLGPGRHGDGNGLYLVVDASGARRWIVRVVVKGQKNRKGAPLRTDFGLGGADVVSLPQARERALESRRMAKQGLNPRFNARQEIPTFEEVAQQVHIDRLPTWKNARHGQQRINTLRDYAFPKIGRMSVDATGRPEVLMCLSPVWTDKHETTKRPAQRLRDAPRCTVKAKRTRERCRCPAVTGWNVCRMHGAGGGAPRGAAHPNFRHGISSRDMVELRRLAGYLRRTRQMDD